VTDRVRTLVATPDPDEPRRHSPVRDDLCRSAPFTLTRAVDEGSDGLTIEGYGAVFNSPTRISGWEGDFEEIIAPGAFKKSLRERTPIMQFDHGQHPLLGGLPLGRWTVAEEDERGLHLVGRVFDDWLFTPFRSAIRDGGVKGMSFRFAVVNDIWTDAAGIRLRDHEIADMLYNGAGDRGPIRRTLREVRASEAGPVVWPAYEDTSVGVRSRGTVVIDLGRLRQPEYRQQLAEVVALIESATRDAAQETKTSVALLGSGYTPGTAVAFVNRDGAGLDELRHTGELSVQLQPTRSTETVDGPPPDGTPTDPPAPPAPPEPSNEPQATAPPADDHPAGPDVTDRAAGEHSAPARPVNPFERRDLIRREFRSYTNRVLALPRHQPPKENSA
jgi:HK97 family phage prohead protease